MGNRKKTEIAELSLQASGVSRGVAAVPSAGVQPGILPQILADYGSEVILNAGTGIMDHPQGPAAGVLAFFEAWERYRAQESFSLEDLPEGPLHAAIDKWGNGHG